jgi:hypothetical protein
MYEPLNQNKFEFIGYNNNEEENLDKNFYNNLNENSFLLNKKLNDKYDDDSLSENETQNMTIKKKQDQNFNSNNFQDNIVILIDNEKDEIEFENKNKNIKIKCKIENNHINKKKLPGRKKLNTKNTKTHDKYSNFNIHQKIKNNFHKFSISFLNRLIINKYGYQFRKFRKIHYKIIKYEKIINNNKKNFLKQTLKEILKNEVTSKFRNISKNQNEKNLYCLSNDFDDDDIINKFLNFSLEEIYKNYYLQKKNTKIFNLSLNEEDEIIFFDDFIEELKKKNEKKYIEKVEKYAKEEFVDYYKKKEEKKKLFIVNKCNK